MSQELTPMDEENKIIVFEDSKIRRTWHKEEWWYVVEDVVFALTESKDVKQYVRRMRKRDEELSKGWVQIVLPLSIETKGGVQKINCSNTEGMFRIIQSITSKKAEPFKRWFARLAKERIDEIENPELAAERARQYYLEMGYDEDWIAKRLQSIEIRGQLTDEWQNRGVKEGIEYSILTAEISRATFGMSPSEYKEFKGLKRDNLRDHMNNLELIFTMLGEESTKQQAREDDAQGFFENKKSAIKGGEAAGEALDAYENKTGKQVISDKNFKQQISEAKQQKRLGRKKKKTDKKV